MDSELFEKLSQIKVNGGVAFPDHLQKVLKLMVLRDEQDPYGNFEFYSESVGKGFDKILTGERIKLMDKVTPEILENFGKIRTFLGIQAPQSAGEDTEE